MVHPVYISQNIMAGKANHTEKPTPARTRASRAVNREGRFTGEYEIIPGPGSCRTSIRAVPAKDTRAPVRILRSTKEWLDQIIAERDLRTYDEAIMFLITERQRNQPSDSGVFPGLKEYVSKGED
jgi:hypothetical protein